MSARVSIPGSLTKTIQQLKDVAGNHSDEEVYALLKECAMDPNEAAERLLLQDTFHEVKRKRDKKKENNKESTDSRWRPGIQGRGGRSNRGNYSSHHVANDAGSEKIVGAGKDIGVSEGTEEGNASTPSPIVHNAEINSAILAQCSLGAFANGPFNVENSTSNQGSISQVPGVSCTIKPEENSATESNNTRASTDTKANNPSGQSYPGVVGSIKHEVGSQYVSEKTINKVLSHDDVGSQLSSARIEESSEPSNYHAHGKSQKSPSFEVNKLLDTPEDTSSTSINSSAGSRPSSNYSSRSQQLNVTQRVIVPNKQWKPKSSTANLVKTSGMSASSNATSNTVEAANHLLSASGSISSCVDASKLQNKFDELPFLKSKNVIIPSHLQVPESERSGLSFGSFYANFGLATSLLNGSDSNWISTPISESSQNIEENVEDPPSSFQVTSPTRPETAYPDNSQSPTQSENLSSKEADVSSGVSAVQDFDQVKSDSSLAQDGPPQSVVHTTPTNPTLGLAPQVLSSQVSAFEGTENQPCKNAHLPSFIVHQPFDPSANYYTQFYRPPIEGDGRFLPFLTPGAATKYTGNLAVLPAQAAESPQEGGNSLVLSSMGPTPITTQAAGLMHSSMPVTQQLVPVFRQATGVHISHYPPNYIPYNQYFSPYFVPPTTIHPLLSNTTFPQQQPSTGGILNAPAAAASATPIKLSMPQFKSGNNVGNTTRVGMPIGCGVHNSLPVGFSPNPTGSSGNSTANDDLTASQFKENTVYLTGQQSEGSGVWFPTPGRDIPAVQGSSFYTLHPQGQHMSFAPSQAGPGAFTGICHHPTQTVAAAAVHPLIPQSQPEAGSVEVVGSPPGIYQQPQCAQVDWSNNY